MKKQINIALRLLLVLTLITGIMYPIFITVISRVFFHDNAGGNLVKRDGMIAGSRLIGQASDSLAYFWPRPSVINYQPLPSGGSNYSWSDQRLKSQVEKRKSSFINGNMLSDTVIVPTEMLFASASGLDPDISPRAAMLQADRVSKARNFNEDQKQKLRLLITKMTEKRQFSLFGEPRINVFLLNLELDKIK
jgi:potassium-transporting ATPase KdpC subunit